MFIIAKVQVLRSFTVTESHGEKMRLLDLLSVSIFYCLDIYQIHQFISAYCQIHSFISTHISYIYKLYQCSYFCSSFICFFSRAFFVYQPKHLSLITVPAKPFVSPDREPSGCMSWKQVSMSAMQTYHKGLPATFCERSCT